MGFLKKNSHLGKWAILGLKMTHPHNSGSTRRIFFEILHNKKDQEVNGTYINGFPEKFFIWVQTGHFDLKMARLHNYGSTLRVFFI